MCKGRALTPVLLLLGCICFGSASDPNGCSKSDVADPCDLEPAIQKWTVWHFWQVLQPGMGKDRVIELLGEPIEKESTDVACIWYYQQAPLKLESGIIQRPKFGFLNFAKTTVSGQEMMLLKTWKEPNWNFVRGYSAQEYQQELNRIDKIRKEQLAEQQRLEEMKRREEEKKRQAEALRQQQLAQERQMRAQQAAAERNKGFSWDNIPKTYWYAGGGVVVGLVIAVILLKKPFSG